MSLRFMFAAIAIVGLNLAIVFCFTAQLVYVLDVLLGLFVVGRWTGWLRVSLTWVEWLVVAAVFLLLHLLLIPRISAT